MFDFGRLLPTRRRSPRSTPAPAVSDARPLTDVLAGNVVEPRFRMTLVGGFAAAALLLAAVGLYGVVAYGVARRRTEIGIRVALGATPASIRSLFVRRALRLAALGVAGGAIAAIPAARVLAGLLYGVDARDPLTLAAAAGVLVADPAARRASARRIPSARRDRAVVTFGAMGYEGEERRFARWTCAACRSARFAPIPSDGRLKCPICYESVAFDSRRHARRDPADRGRAPEEIPPHG